MAAAVRPWIVRSRNLRAPKVRHKPHCAAQGGPALRPRPQFDIVSHGLTAVATECRASALNEKNPATRALRMNIRQNRNC
mgnify:CR=1 FL=1